MISNQYDCCINGVSFLVGIFEHESLKIVVGYCVMFGVLSVTNF